MARKKKQRKKKQSPQEASAAHGTLVDARRNIQRATGENDNAFKTLIWISVAAVVATLLFAILT